MSSTLATIINKHLEAKAPIKPPMKTIDSVRRPFDPRIVAEIVSHYQPRRTGKLKVMPWAQIWTENPDWKKTLGVDSAQRQKSLGETVRKIMKAAPAPVPAVVTEQVKPEPVKRKMGRPRGDLRTVWTKEQADLARSILNMPQWRYRDGKSVNWEEAFRVHPDWGQALKYSTQQKERAIFMSFIGRVRMGKTSRLPSSGSLLPVSSEVVATPIPNGSAGIQIGNRQYELIELEQIVKAHQNKLEHLLFCPHCGHNLVMHTKAYSIARRHSHVEEEL